MSDTDLILWIQNGHQDYLNILLENHIDNIFRSCYRVCLDETQANDITQNVVLKIMKYIHKFEMKSEFSTWYYRIAYNESMTFLKKQKNHIEYDEVENYIIDENTDFYQIDKDIQEKDITDSINTLNVLDRNIILYFYYDDKKIREISEIMELNENTVKTRLSRAKKKLQSLLIKHENNN